MVPTPKENIVLMPYFLKKGILNGFRPCDLAARQIAQKKGQSITRIGPRTRPVPAMAENKTGFLKGKKDDLILGKMSENRDGRADMMKPRGLR